jgi:hypothetical protein
MKAGVSFRSGPRRRPAPWLALAALVLAIELAAISGCFVDVDLGGSRLACSNGECPGGFECVEERCVPEGSGGDDDGAADAGVPTSDAAPEPPDGAPPDAPPPDAPPPSVCDEQYGQSPGYQFCDVEPGSCEFFISSDVGLNCADVCANAGGKCFTAFNEVDMMPCERGVEEGCVAGLLSQICVCSISVRGP